MIAGIKDKHNGVYTAFIWHGFFLALTMSMIDFTTVLPSLVSKLSHSKILFGFLYSVLLGAPGIFNLIFSHFLEPQKKKKRFLLLGIYLRAVSFLGMAVFVFLFGRQYPVIVMTSLFFWILFLQSVVGLRVWLVQILSVK